MSKSMIEINSLYTFAQSYDCGTYGAGGFGDEQVCATTEQSGGSTPATLPATGDSLFIGVSAGLALMIIAVAIFARLRKKRVDSKSDKVR